MGEPTTDHIPGHANHDGGQSHRESGILRARGGCSGSSELATDGDLAAVEFGDLQRCREWRERHDHGNADGTNRGSGRGDVDNKQWDSNVRYRLYGRDLDGEL